MRTAALSTVLVTILTATSIGGPSEAPMLSGRDAIDLLQQGNERFVDGNAEYRHTSPDRIASTAANGQGPFATVLACADSRVPVELLFDRGVGDIFVVRVAGNVAGPMTVGSMEYAIGMLNTPAVVVLGHTGCGAVGAAVDGGELPGNIGSVVAPIAAACDHARNEHPEATGAELVNFAVEANTFAQIERLIQNSQIVRDRVAAGNLEIVAAVYDLHTGQVRFLGEHPTQAALVEAAGSGTAASASTNRATPTRRRASVPTRRGSGN